MNRIRIEQAKANSAAVLRQQVFHFDPNYGDPFAGGVAAVGIGNGSVNDNSSVAGGGSVVGGGSAVPVPPYGAPNRGGGGATNGRGSFSGMENLQSQNQQQHVVVTIMELVYITPTVA